MSTHRGQGRQLNEIAALGPEIEGLGGIGAARRLRSPAILVETSIHLVDIFPRFLDEADVPDIETLGTSNPERFGSK